MRRAFGQAGGEAQPEAHACGVDRILAEIENQRSGVELALRPLSKLCHAVGVPRIWRIQMVAARLRRTPTEPLDGGKLGAAGAQTEAR